MRCGKQTSWALEKCAVLVGRSVIRIPPTGLCRIIGSRFMKWAMSLVFFPSLSWTFGNRHICWITNRLIGPNILRRSSRISIGEQWKGASSWNVRRTLLWLREAAAPNEREREMNSLTKENGRLGFIGIGNMGSRIAKRLLKDGYQVIAYNRSREAAEALAEFGAMVADSIAELASRADV